jgi:ABC-2 type transport system permease protein/oleandomycin transport system permease protein
VTTTTATAASSGFTGARPEVSSGSSLGWAASNVCTIAWRNLLAILRVPELLFFSTLQPIMFVLLFRYVFAGSIGKGAHIYYPNFMMPGIFVQTVCFGAVSTAIGLSEDLHKGLIERFRALPMSRSAVLAGRTVADICRNVFVIIVMTAVGLAVGFRPTGGALDYFFAFLLMLLFAFALSWGFALIGLLAPNTESAQVMAFPLLFPLTFASSCFVPVSSMPTWLQGFANNQPVSQVADAARYLMNRTPPPHEHQVLLALAWTLGLLVVLVPLSVRRFRNAI